MTTIELIEKLKELKELQALWSETEAEIDEIEKEIKDYMDDIGETSLNVDVYKVKYVTVKSSRFDQKKFREENEGIYNNYQKQLSYKRFTVA